MEDSKCNYTELKERFLSTSIGNVLKVKHLDPSKPIIYLMLCKGGVKWHKERYPYRAVNLNNGYLWGTGDTTLDGTFNNWFTHKGELIIADLEILNRYEISNVVYKSIDNE